MRNSIIVAIVAGLFFGCAGGARQGATASWPATAAQETDPDPDFEKLLPGSEVRVQTQDEISKGHTARSARAFESNPHARPNPFAPGAGFVTFEPNEVGVEFHIFSIGQADSMLAIAPNGTTLLYDLGELNWNSQTNCLRVRDDIKALTGEFHVDYLVISHFHQDHIGAPPRIIRSSNGNERRFPGGGIFCLLEGGEDFFTVGTLIDRGDGEEAFIPERQPSHQFIIDSVARWKQNKTLEKRVAAGFAQDLIEMGPGIDVAVLAAAGKVHAGDSGALAAVEAASAGDTYRADQQASPNDFSIALEFTVGGDFELFTAGDLTGGPGDDPAPFIITQHHQVYTNVEAHMVDHWMDIGRESDVEVYVANHHGSQNSSIPALAAALEPEVVVYSAGGRYGHPKKVIADRFLGLGSDQLVTHSADDSEWSNGVFPARYGNGWNNPVGDILVFAPMNGEWFTVATEDQVFEYPILSDVEEQQ